MRTLFEIIEAAKSNQPLTVEEGRYAICCVDGLSTFDHNDIRRLAQGRGSAMQYAEDGHQRWHRALNMSPREYLGESYDPANLDYQSRRQVSLRLFKKIAAPGGEVKEVEGE